MGSLKRSALGVGDSILNGRYTISDIIHTSGMANVYLVTDSNLNKVWCLKEIKKSEAGKNRVEYYSLLQEANIMKSLNNSNIPRIVTIEEENDSLFIVMDYVDGASIKTWIQKKGRISQDMTVAWMKQICQVMIYLHSRKHPIFYRDMKPDNVMVQSDGSIKVLDFGISVEIKEKNQKIEKALGTKGYAAPEQSKSGNICDLRSDIYAMGKTMYYMLTGINPSKVPKNKIKPIRDIDSSISMGLEKVVEKCTRENPDERYQTCEELLYALQTYETLDSSYRKKSILKVRVSVGMFVLSLFLLVGSFIPLKLDAMKKSKEYESLLLVAEQSGDAVDYKKAISIHPEIAKPYIDYISSLKRDGMFSLKEEENLLGLVNPNLETLSEDKDYGEFAFNMGKLYWFYYENGEITSIKWFEDAIDSGYSVDVANVYCELGKFKRDIEMSMAESSDSGMYKMYWSNLIQAKNVSDGELIELQTNLALVECISSYAYRLNVDGVSKEEILAQIDEVKSYLSQISPTSENSLKVKSEIESALNGLTEKVEVAYKSDGGEK